MEDVHLELIVNHEKTFRDRGYRILLMALKKPIEITEHPIEIHGNICSIAITTDDKYRTIEWVRAKDEKDGYWIESEITTDKIYDFKIDHKLLSDAEKIHEGITEYKWIAEEIRKDKIPSHINLIESTHKKMEEDKKTELNLKIWKMHQEKEGKGLKKIFIFFFLVVVLTYIVKEI